VKISWILSAVWASQSNSPLASISTILLWLIIIIIIITKIWIFN
jgi:hypothetical protein